MEKRKSLAQKWLLFDIGLSIYLCSLVATLVLSFVLIFVLPYPAAKILSVVTAVFFGLMLWGAFLNICAWLSVPNYIKNLPEYAVNRNAVFFVVVITPLMVFVAAEIIEAWPV